MKPLIVDVRHLYPPSCTFEASVRTHALFFKLTLCPLSTTTRYSSHAHCTLLHIYFHCDKIFHQNSHLCTQYVSHAPNLAQRGPQRGRRPIYAGCGCARNIHRPVPARRKRERRPRRSPTREKRRAPNRPQRSGVRACRHGATYRRAGPPDGRIRPARALSWTPLSLLVSNQKGVMLRHRSLPPSLPPQDHHLGGKAAEPVGHRTITSQKKARNLARRFSSGHGWRLVG